jgi:biotin carboxyl carrier protein
MSDERRDGVDRAERLIPEITRRLRLHGLGEIEARDGDLRVRVTAGGSQTVGPPVRAVAGHAADGGDAPSDGPAAHTDPVPSPGVGYFLYADGLGPGLEVAAGDILGHVDVLGVRHEVRAAREGTIRNLVAETGEAVEYGQTLLEMEPAR